MTSASAAGLCEFVDASPSPFHVCATIAEALTDFAQLHESDVWPADPGKYFVVRGGSLIAWSTQGTDPQAPFRIVGGHTDSPNLRVKQHPDLESAGWQLVGLEPYGGAWLNSWLDRELRLAGRLALADGRVAEVGPASAFPAATLPAPSDRVYLPGMIDVHCHGGGGFDFPGSDVDGARAAAAHHLGRGTTTLLASLVSAAPEKLLERIATLAPLVDDDTVAGLHLEGPFLAQEVCGAQDPRYIVDGDPALLATLLDAAGGRIRSMTVAAETPHFADLARQLSAAGAVVSVGHTAGDYDTVVAPLPQFADAGAAQRYRNSADSFADILENYRDIISQFFTPNDASALTEP